MAYFPYYSPYACFIIFLSEILIDVWVEKQGIKYKEIPVMFMGNQHWVKKISKFLLRKVRGRA